MATTISRLTENVEVKLTLAVVLVAIGMMGICLSLTLEDVKESRITGTSQDVHVHVECKICLITHFLLNQPTCNCRYATCVHEHACIVFLLYRVYVKQFMYINVVRKGLFFIQRLMCASLILMFPWLQVLVSS